MITDRTGLHLKVVGNNGEWLLIFIINLFLDINSLSDLLHDVDDNNSLTSANQSRARLDEELRVAYLFEELLLGSVVTENTTTLKNMGHQFEDLVFECNFRGNDCR